MKFAQAHINTYHTLSAVAPQSGVVYSRGQARLFFMRTDRDHHRRITFGSKGRLMFNGPPIRIRDEAERVKILFIDRPMPLDVK